MNFLKIRKSGNSLLFGNGQTETAPSAFGGLSDGDYLAGFRPNHLELKKHAPNALEFTGKLSVTEITGSETFVHLDHQGESWVGLVHGIKELKIGTSLNVYLDPKHIYFFAQDGKSIAAASYAAAA
jgi:glycerol transport system ATP-binding protein